MLHQAAPILGVLVNARVLERASPTLEGRDSQALRRSISNAFRLGCFYNCLSQGAALMRLFLQSVSSHAGCQDSLSVFMIHG